MFIHRTIQYVIINRDRCRSSAARQERLAKLQVICRKTASSEYSGSKKSLLLLQL
jgi:hypothetical protein